MNEALENLQNQLSAVLSRLSSRERMLVGLTAAVAFVLIAGGIVWSVNSGLNKKRRTLAQKVRNLEAIVALESDYKAAKSRDSAASRKLKGNRVSLYSLIEGAATKLELKLNDLNERTSAVRDSELKKVSVDVNLKQVSIDKLTGFLKEIEGGKSKGVVRVTKLKAKTRFDNPELLDVNMTVATWKAGS